MNSYPTDSATDGVHYSEGFKNLLAFNSHLDKKTIYRSLFAHNPLAQVLCDLEGNIFQANSAFIKIVNRLGQRAKFDSLNNCDAQPTLNCWELLLLKKLENLEINEEFSLTKAYPDHHGITLQLSGVKLELANQPLILLNVIEIEQETKTTIDFLLNIINSLSDPIFVKDAEHRFVLLNNFVSKFVGYSREELIGKSDYDFFPPEEAKIFWEKDELVMATEIENINEEYLTDIEGNVKIISTKKNCFKDPQGNKFLVGMIRDITEIKKTEEELRQSQQLLQLVMDTIPEFIFWKDRNSVYLGCNQNLALVAGVSSPEAIIGKTDYDLAWKKEEADFFRACDRRVMLSNTPELRIIEPQLQANGKQAWLETNKAPLHDLKGNVIGIMGTYQDITERKQTELALQKLNQELESRVIERTATLSKTLENLKATQKQLIETERMAMLGQLVAGVAHEINTPVGTSITVASTLKAETDAFAKLIQNGKIKRSTMQDYLETAQECAQLIETNLHRAGELIQSFKQVAVDHNSLDVRSFLVKSYVEEILVSLEPKFKKTKHKVEVVGDATITITSYPGAIAQIVTNLIVNSLIHAYRPGEAGLLKFEIKREGTRIILEYSDNGCGIPEEHLENIFDPFFSTARDRGGSGLGLHIIYNLVTQKLQGKIDVRTNLGLGTAFIISFSQKIQPNY